MHPLPGMPPSSITVGGHAGHVAEALKQPLLLPKDMEAYRSFTHLELFLSLKRDLAMVSYFRKFFLYFILKVKFFFFFFLGYTTSFCGQGMGEERS